MGECIGLDFGTTYSVVSHLIDNHGINIPEAIDFGDEEKSITSIESLVVKRNDETKIGYEAVPDMRRSGAHTFKGFKMLLDCEANEAASRGFVQENTPEAITALFMEELFKKVGIVSPDCKVIDKVVVGVPYVWTEHGEDSRKFEVVEIVQRATNASLVEFQSEPTLACAYFVQEINRHRKKNFQGHILVIDYGGGTLDVTLCKATVEGKKSSIEVQASWGAGENTEGTIGSAGLAFMETVADFLLKERQIEIPNKEDNDYQKFVKDIEKIIKNQSSHLRQCIEREKRYFSSGGQKYKEEISGDSAYFKGEEYFVTYEALVCAYNESIRPVLERVLKTAKADMDDKWPDVKYNDYTSGTFKIATIGGFCNFALTEKQIRTDTDWLRSHAGNDTRYTELDEAVKPKNRELAVAFGAALNANDIVGIKRQFPYTLCFYAEKSNGKGGFEPDTSEDTTFVVFKEGEEYEPGQPVFAGYTEDGKTVKIKFGGYNLPFISRERDGMISDIKKPTVAMDLYNGVAVDGVYIAMAMERNEKLTLYVYNAKAFDKLSKENQKDPKNSALIGAPSAFPNIHKLLGGIYRDHSRRKK